METILYSVAYTVMLLIIGSAISIATIAIVEYFVKPRRK